MVEDLEDAQPMTRNRKARKATARKAAHRMHGGKHSTAHSPVSHQPKAIKVHEPRGHGHTKSTASTPADAVLEEIRRIEG
jgi:hypothetical protein